MGVRSAQLFGAASSSGLAMGQICRNVFPGTLLGGEHTAAEIRQIVTNLH
jgi:hypothetical protein